MPIYEYTVKGLANKDLVFNRIYDIVSLAVKTSAINATQEVVKAALAGEYRRLVEEGFLYVVDKRKKNGGKPCPE